MTMANDGDDKRLPQDDDDSQGPAADSRSPASDANRRSRASRPERPSAFIGPAPNPVLSTPTQGAFLRKILSHLKVQP